LLDRPALEPGDHPVVPGALGRVEQDERVLGLHDTVGRIDNLQLAPQLPAVVEGQQGRLLRDQRIDVVLLPDEVLERAWTGVSGTAQPEVEVPARGQPGKVVGLAGRGQRLRIHPGAVVHHQLDSGLPVQLVE
jgi:hypothetical protein